MKIIPAVLTNNLEEANELLGAADGVVDRVQIDIIDGRFSDNHTIDPSLLNDHQYNLEFDFHLMVREPINWIKKCVRAGGSRIIGHIEEMESQSEFVETVHQQGVEAGLAIDLKTPLGNLAPGILSMVEVILIMSVPAGFGGQEFDKSSLEKIKKLDEMRAQNSEFKYLICDDGGVTLDLVDDEERAGADEVCVGKRLFKGDLSANIKRYAKAAEAKN